jgi:hypothetical protein
VFGRNIRVRRHSTGEGAVELFVDQLHQHLQGRIDAMLAEVTITATQHNET